MSVNIIRPEDTVRAARSSEPVRWHLALVGGTSGASRDAGVAGLKGRFARNTGDERVPVRISTAQGADTGHRGAVLAGAEGATELGAERTRDAAPVAFMFPGLGDHHLHMGRDLYRDFAVFRETVDRCAEALAPELGVDLREVVFPASDDDRPAGAAPAIDLRRMLGRAEGPAAEDADGEPGRSATERRLDRTRLAQPALFVVEYALARLWESWGARPALMIGYSLGEYVAAALAGVLSETDALRLVARRAALIDALPEGAMLAVLLPEEAVLPRLGGTLSLSAVNGPELCVVGGPVADVAALETALRADGVTCRRVQTTHAFHTAMMEPAVAELTALARTLTLHAPRVPYVSNVTGRPITDADATDPAYWARHLVSPVRFADGMRALADVPLLLETGPGQTLSSIAVADGRDRTVVASMRHPLENRSDSAVALKALGRLWLAGADIDWSGFPADELDTVADAAATAVRQPGTDHEPTGTGRELHALWARLLKTDELPYDTSFFELGGNSLLATRLTLRVKRAFDVELTLRQVYENATLHRMADAIDTLRAGGLLAEDGAGTSHTGRAQARFRLPNGMTVVHQNEAETRHFYEDIFEHRTYAKNGISVPDGATVVDVGGNLGLFTLFAHHEARDVKVYAFEPAPPMFALLRQNVADHGVNAELFETGLSDAEGEATFTFYPRSSGMSSFHPDEEEEKHNLRTIIANQQKTGAEPAEAVRPAETAEPEEPASLAGSEELLGVRLAAMEFTARLRPLSAVIREQGIERIDLIKIDVQKSERQVLDGIDDEHWPLIRQMVLEAHDADGEVERLARRLGDRGFAVTVEQDELYVGTDIHNIYAVRGDR